MNSFDDRYRLRPGDTGYWQTCECIGEHQGDEYEQAAIDGTTWLRWTCCDEEEEVDA